MGKAKPITCPKSDCRKPFPSRRAWRKHIDAGCHRPTHITCSVCDLSLAGAARYAETLMARTEAAVHYVNRTTFGGNHERAKMAAFLDLFHPEMRDETKRRLINGTP